MDGGICWTKQSWYDGDVGKLGHAGDEDVVDCKQNTCSDLHYILVFIIYNCKFVYTSLGIF